MEDELRQIAKELGYSKIDRLISIPVEIRLDLFNEILKNSINDIYAILFFPARMIQISPYGTRLAMCMPVRAADHYLTMHPKLNEKFLRTVFTGFEFILYKLCHICFENHRHDYEWESEKTRARFKRVCDLLTVVDKAKYKTLFDEIFFVRDAFAHSFIELVEIKYRGKPLSDSFGNTFIGGSHRNAEHIFVDDLNELFTPVMELFMQHQMKQIDANKFAKLCNRLVNKRSLAPGR
jgi:hypothetical protein